MKRKHLTLIIFSTLAIIFAAALIAGLMLYVKAARYGQVSLQVVDNHNHTSSLGSTVLLNVAGLLPWGQNIVQSDLSPTAGTTLCGNIAVHTQKITWQGKKIQLTIPLKSYRTGTLKSGELSVTVERAFFRNGPHKLTINVPLPELEVTALNIQDRNQLPLADQLSSQQKPTYHYWVIAVAAVLIIVGSIAFILLKNRRKNVQIELPPWEIARQHLSELRHTANSGKQPLSWCVAKLTDVVRDYLSRRFQWPVNQQTTAEFFASLRHKKTPLTTQQMRYLEEFLTSADLVKFANIRPDQNDFSLAVDRAEELVRETAADTEQNTADISEQTGNRQEDV
ncbi:MAG: hypothetical protein E7052_07555 [Lentisphaerae bacterium]|nr:hypothetical protein [Lentisphaerota bacterium]